VVGLLPFLLILVTLGGCRETGDGNEVLSSEEARELGLSGGARLHRVTLGGRGAEEHAVPTRIQALPGDGIEFLTVDHRVHTLEFVADSLEPEAQQFLESSGQTASPPLVSRGSRFVLRLQDAPPGRYRFTSNGHGGIARGVVEVGPPAGDTSATPPG
jgi:plastocyanin